MVPVSLASLSWAMALVDPTPTPVSPGPSPTNSLGALLGSIGLLIASASWLGPIIVARLRSRRDAGTDLTPTLPDATTVSIADVAQAAGHLTGGFEALIESLRLEIFRLRSDLELTQAELLATREENAHLKESVAALRLELASSLSRGSGYGVAPAPRDGSTPYDPQVVQKNQAT